MDMERHAGWTFLSNHAHVLLCLAGDSDLRIRDIAGRVGITERAVARILTELEEAGFIQRVRQGRRNHYEIDGSQHLRHPIEARHTVEELLRALAPR